MNRVDMSLDDCIKQRKQTDRRSGPPRRGNFNRFRGDRGGRGFRRERGGRDRFSGFRGGRERGGRFRRDRDDFRRPRRSFDRRDRLDGDRNKITRLFVKDLPKTVSNNDLRV
jgi:hypothetical protein